MNEIGQAAIGCVAKDGGRLGASTRTRTVARVGKRTTASSRTHRGVNPWSAWEARSKDEAYWREHVERGLLKAEFVRDYVLRLWFEQELGVEIYELDFDPMFVKHNPGGVFQALKSKTRFKQVLGNYSLIWLNPITNAYDEGAIDLAPECVRFFCEQYGHPVKVSNGNGK